MTIKVDKKLVDNLIKTTKDYYSHMITTSMITTNEKKYLQPLLEATKDLNTILNYYQTSLVSDLARYSVRNPTTYDQIYQALEVMGIKVMDRYNYEKTKDYINKIISFSGGLVMNELYEYLFDLLEDHTAVKNFLRNEGYSSSQIASAKFQFKSRRL